ncbi:exodeoxyribonuclease V subunit gamma [Gordonia iterans]
MLTVHRAERADVLADVLAGQLAVPPADPMARETVAVPARGVERWLQQRLALRLGGTGRSDGIAANIDFPSPERLLRQVVLATADDPDAAEPWYSDRLVWPVLHVLDDEIGDPRLAVLRNHLGGEDRRGRRLAAASVIAGLFAGYGWQRPAMLVEWAAGHDTDGTGGADGPGRPLPEGFTWQPWLWRRVRDRIGQPHLAEQLDAVAARLAAEPALVELPERLAFFGPTRIPESLRRLLGALAAGRDVSLFLPHPSEALWRAVAETAGPVPRPRDRRTGPRPEHPLLAALARDVCELQEVLGPLRAREVYHPLPAADATSSTVLAAVQEGLRCDRLETVPGAVADDSLEVHACHGPERQVEVLRDRLLRLFDDHPELQPRDVVVMCPDVETFAPLIAGTFGQAGQDHPGYSLRVKLADRGLRETNEVLDVLAAVLDLAAGRVRSGDLLDLIAQPAVRRCFEFTDDDLELLAGWVERAGIRWGIDGTQRDRFGLAGFPQGTAVAGRDRVLLGVLAEETSNEWLGVGLPLDGIESTKIDLAGRFAEFVDRLGALLAAMDTPRPAPEWAQLLVEAVDRLTAAGRETQWQRAQAVEMIGESLGSAGARGVTLALADLRDLMDGLLAARPTRSNFRTGELTVCTLTPMRSVPHRAVVLLGMDSGAFPRGSAVDGDDVLARLPLIGERDRHDEDRQVFLDALTAAQDHLLVFYTGSDPVTGGDVPPPVVVEELIDTAGRILGGSAPGVVIRHTLHPFDERNFLVGRDGGPRSYDARLLHGARELARLNASGAPGSRPALLRDAVLPPCGDADDIDLAALIDFFAAPTERFVRQRLGAMLPRRDETHPDELEVDLDGLAQWKIGDRHLRGFLGGEDPRVLGAAELRRGSLPPFAIGAALLAPIEEKAQAIGQLAQTHRAHDHGDTVDVLHELPDGRRLYGTVGDVFDEQLVAVTYSRLKPGHRLSAWIRLLAIAVGASRTVTEAVVVGGGRGRRAEMRRLRLPDDPGEILRRLIAVRDAGLRAPLWLPPAAAEAAARGYASGRPAIALKAVRGLGRWEFKDPYAGLVLDDDPDPERVLPVDALIGMAGAAPFVELAPELPEVVEHDGHTPAGQSFVRLARAVFGPLLAEESQR